MVKALGDRVSDWMILNEPNVFTALGYLLGIHAPGRRSLPDFLHAVHTVNLAHGDAFRAMKALREDLRIGTAFNFTDCQPARDREEDAAAAERWHALVNETFLRPALRGEYPGVTADGTMPLDALGFRDGDAERMRAPLDFVGVNLYTRGFVEAAEADDGLTAIVGARQTIGGGEGPRTDFGWEVWPDALYNALVRLARDYDSPVIEVTENGCSYGDGPDRDGVVRDPRRIEFLKGYLEAVHRAIADGADVRGYHVWTLIDNFEWAEGFEQRFGLVHVDFDTCERTPKESSRWYGRVAAENGFEA